MRYDVIQADCPWQYENSRMKGRSAETQYATLSVEELCALDVKALAARDCVLLLWAVPSMVPEALRVVSAWGFSYKTMIPWFKLTPSSAARVEDFVKTHDATAEDLPFKLEPNFGMGWWVRGCFEPIIIATKGKPRPIDQWVGIISAAFRHSRKPTSLHMYAEQFGKNRLELFAREHHSGWNCTGIELTGEDVRDFIARESASDER